MNLARNLVSRDARFPSEARRVAANQACPASSKNTERCRIREGGHTFRRSQVVDLGEVRETCPGEGRTPPDSASRSRHHQGRCVQHRTRCHQVARDQWQQETGAAQLGAQAAGAQQLGAAAGAQQLGAAGRSRSAPERSSCCSSPCSSCRSGSSSFCPSRRTGSCGTSSLCRSSRCCSRTTACSRSGQPEAAAGRRGGRSAAGRRGGRTARSRSGAGRGRSAAARRGAAAVAIAAAVHAGVGVVQAGETHQRGGNPNVLHDKLSSKTA